MPRLVLFCTLLFTPAAFAQDEAPRLAVVGLHDSALSTEQQEALIAAMTEAVDVTGKADGIETDLVAEAIRGREEVILKEALLANGRQDLLQGKNAYNQALTEDAIDSLQSAVENLSNAVAATNDTKDLWEAWVYLGTAHLGTGSDDGRQMAEISFRAAVALNPERNPSAAVFPPEVTEFYETQRALLRQAAVSVTVRVEGDAPARISVDGVDRGDAPASLTEVLPGVHHVVAKADGDYAYQLVRIEQQADDAPAPEFVLNPGPPVLGTSAESAGQRARQISGLYRAIGAHADNVDLILLAGTVESDVHLQLYAPGADAFSQPVVLPYEGDVLDEAETGMGELMGMLGEDGKLPASALAPLAAPLYLDTNQHLARMLMDPTAAPATPSQTTTVSTTKRKSPVVGIVVGVLAAGAAGTGGYLGYNALTADSGRYGGTINVGPF